MEDKKEISDFLIGKGWDEKLANICVDTFQLSTKEYNITIQEYYTDILSECSPEEFVKYITYTSFHFQDLHFIIKGLMKQHKFDTFYLLGVLAISLFYTFFILP